MYSNITIHVPPPPLPPFPSSSSFSSPTSSSTLEGLFEKFISVGESAIDGSVDRRKYNFWREGSADYILEVLNVEFDDAGEYKCGNVVNIELTGSLGRGEEGKRGG